MAPGMRMHRGSGGATRRRAARRPFGSARPTRRGETPVRALPGAAPRPAAAVREAHARGRTCRARAHTQAQARVRARHAADNVWPHPVARGVTKGCQRRRRARLARFRARSGPTSRLLRFQAGPTFLVGRRRSRRAPVPAPAAVPLPEPSPPASLPIRGRARRTGRNAGRGARCAAAVRLVPSARRSAVRLRLRDRRAPFAAPPRAACLPAFRPPSTEF